MTHYNVLVIPIIGEGNGNVYWWKWSLTAAWINSKHIIQFFSTSQLKIKPKSTNKEIVRGDISCHPTLYGESSKCKESTRQLSVMKWKIDAEDSCSSLQSISGNDDEEREDKRDVEHRPQSEDHEGGNLGRDLGKAGLEEDRSNGFQQVRTDQFANWNFSCSILSTNFHWEDGCIFQRLQTYDNSILPKFSFPSSLMAIKIDIHKASDVWIYKRGCLWT